MEKYLASFLIAVTCITATAQTKENVPPAETATYKTICMTADSFLKLVYEFDEIPFVKAYSHSVFDNSIMPMVIFTNPKTQSFTIAEMVDSNTYCVLTLGNKFEPMPKKLIDEFLSGKNQGKL